MAFALRIADLAGVTVLDNAPFQRATVTWDIDGPGAVEVTLADRDVAGSPPTDGLVAWYRADDLALSDGALVGTWPDASGNGRHATQATDANKPTFLASGIGGRPSVRFDGVKYLLMTLPAMTAATIVFLGRYVSGGFTPGASLVAGNADPRIGLFADSNDATAPHAVHAKSAGFGTNFLRESADSLADLEAFHASLNWTGTSAKLRLNGADVGTPASTSAETLATAWRLATHTLTSKFDAGEYLIYSRSLTDAEVQQVERYLASRWRLSSPAPFWTPGQRRIVVLKDGTNAWQGWLLDMERDGKPGEVTWTARGLGLASVLDKRVVHGDVTYSATVATTIAWNLIQHAQSQTDGNHGFTLGTVSGTAPARTRTYCDGDVIREAIDDLASRDPGGFDWEIDANGAFNAWVPRRAVNKTSTSFSDADVMELRASRDVSELASYVTALGDDPDGPCGPPLVVRSNSSLASTYKRREVALDVGTNDSGELTEAADHELAIRRRGGLQLEVVVEPRADPKGLASLDIGDRVTAVLPAELGGTQTVRLVRKSVTLEPPDFSFAALQFEGD